MGEPEPAPGGFGRALPAWVSAIGPVTLITAVLFYFGYVSSRAQYDYFGVDVDVIGLGTQDYIMRSPQPLLVPLLTLTLLGACGLLAHLLLTRRVTALRARRARTVRRAVRASMITGGMLLTSGVVLLFAYGALGASTAYALATPLLVISGAGLVAYAWHFAEPAPAGEPDPAPMLRRSARFLLYVLIVAATFWATATVAQLTGRGLAREIAAHPDRLPRVVLDTKERLYLRDGIVEESRLPDAEDQEFHYRYRKLRLLVIGKERMFLVPDTWSASNSTMVVPVGDGVRVQFQFRNDTPFR